MAERITSDLALAAYIRLRAKTDKLKIQNTDTFRKNGREFVFKFDDPDDQFDEISLQFSNSESFSFDNEVRVLKTLLKNKR